MQCWRAAWLSFRGSIYECVKPKNILSQLPADPQPESENITLQHCDSLLLSHMMKRELVQHWQFNRADTFSSTFCSDRVVSQDRYVLEDLDFRSTFKYCCVGILINYNKYQIPTKSSLSTIKWIQTKIYVWRWCTSDKRPISKAHKNIKNRTEIHLVLSEDGELPV